MGEVRIHLKLVALRDWMPVRLQARHDRRRLVSEGCPAGGKLPIEAPANLCPSDPLFAECDLGPSTTGGDDYGIRAQIPVLVR